MNHLLAGKSSAFRGRSAASLVRTDQAGHLIFFRALKSELSLRPLFHQLEPRVKAHILVAFLGYALWVTLKHLLRRKNSNLSPAQALALLSTLQSADIVLPTTDGRELRLRRLTEPSPEQEQLLHQLGITLPEHFNLNLECSENSAIA